MAGAHLCHTETIPLQHTQGLIRADIHRLEKAVERVRIYASTIDCKLIEKQHGYDFTTELRGKDGLPDFDKLDESIIASKCGATYMEIKGAKHTISQLRRYLDPKRVAKKAA